MSEKHIHSYSSPFAVGHAALAARDGNPGLFDGEVFVQEKVDGSQFSFMLDDDGEVYFRSRKSDIYPQAAGMFSKGVEAVLSVKDKLNTGYTYRAEYLSKPKHNCLPYDRTPKGYIVIFDIETTPTDFLSPFTAEPEAERLGFDFAPVYFVGKIEGVEQLQSFLTNKSILGGPIEGIVIKPKDHRLWGIDKKVLMAKYVRQEFKEKHNKDWKKDNPGRKEIVQAIIDTYRTPQRWGKAIQHLKEEGKLEGSPKDIGLLFKEIPRDVLAECGDEIKESLFRYFWKDISRGVTAGVADWYKNKLVENEFAKPLDTNAQEIIDFCAEGEKRSTKHLGFDAFNKGHEYPEGHPALTDPDFRPKEK